MVSAHPVRKGTGVPTHEWLEAGSLVFCPCGRQTHGSQQHTVRVIRVLPITEHLEVMWVNQRHNQEEGLPCRLRGSVLQPGNGSL